MAVTGSAEHVYMFTCVQTRVSKFLTTWLSVSSSSASSGFLELMKKKTVLFASVGENNFLLLQTVFQTSYYPKKLLVHYWFWEQLEDELVIGADHQYRYFSN